MHIFSKPITQNIIIFILLGIVPKGAYAANPQWTGAVDTEMSTVGNWTAAPSGQPTEYPTLATNFTPQLLAAPLSIQSIDFISVAQPYTITIENTLNLTSTGVANNSTVDQTIVVSSTTNNGIMIFADGASTNSATSPNVNYTVGNIGFNGQLSFNGASPGPGGLIVLQNNSSTTPAINLTGSGQVTLAELYGTNSTSTISLVSGSVLAFGSSGVNRSIAGVISGGGGILMQGTTPTQIQTLLAANTYTGGTTINGGILSLSGVGDLAPTGSVSVTSGTFDISAAGGNRTIGDLSGSGKVTLGVNTLTTGTSTTFTEFSGIISGVGGGLVKTGSGTLKLSGVNTYTGNTGLDGGTVEVVAAASLGSGAAINVTSNTTLQIDNSITLTQQVNLGAQLTVNNTSPVIDTLSGNILGVGNLVKTGTGTLILTGVSSYTGGTEVKNGTLQGDTDSLQGSIFNDNSTVVFDQSFDAPFVGSLSGNGTVNKINSGDLEFNTNQSGFTGTTNVTAGKLTLNTIIGSDVNIKSGGILEGTGTINKNLTILSGGTISPGNSIGTINVGGNYGQQSTGTYIWEASSPSQTDFINVSGIAGLGGILDIQFTGDCLVNTHYPILHADGGVTGTFSTILNLPQTLNPYILSEVIYKANDVFFSCHTDFANINDLTQNEQHVAIQIDSIVNPNADQLEILDSLFDLSENQIKDALNEMSGEQYTYLIQLARYSNERFNQGIYNTIRSTLIPCWCPDPCDKIQTWFLAETGHCFANRDTNSAGIKSTNWDLSIGGHMPVKSGVIVGLAANYQRDYLDFHQGGHSTRQTGQMALYGIARGDVYYLFADAIFGMTSGEYKRPIDFGDIHRKAKSKPQTTQGMFYGEAGLNFCLDCGCNLLVQPFIGAEYGHYVQKRLAEHGAGSLDLSIKNITLNTFDSYLGMHFFGTIACINLSADLSWQHRFDYTEIKINNHFADFGDNFKIKGCNLGHDGVKGSINASIQINETFNIYADVFGERWKHWTAHGADLGIAAWW